MKMKHVVQEKELAVKTIGENCEQLTYINQIYFGSCNHKSREAIFFIKSKGTFTLRFYVTLEIAYSY